MYVAKFIRIAIYHSEINIPCGLEVFVVGSPLFVIYKFSPFWIFEQWRRLETLTCEHNSHLTFVAQTLTGLLQIFQPSRFSRKPPVFRDHFRPPVFASKPHDFLFSSNKSKICCSYCPTSSKNSILNAS